MSHTSLAERALNLTFATKGELAISLLTEAYADGVHLDFVAGDEVYGACPKLRTFLEEHGQAYVLRVRSTFTLILGAGTCLTCAQAVTKHLKHKRRWTICSAGDGSKGERTYAWAWIATASPTHHLLVRKHRKTGELAYHYCFVPDGQPATLPRLVAAAGLRWPVEETFEFGKDLFGLDQAQVRLYARHGSAGGPPRLGTGARLPRGRRGLRDRQDQTAQGRGGDSARRDEAAVQIRGDRGVGEKLRASRSPTPPPTPS